MTWDGMKPRWTFTRRFQKKNGQGNFLKRLDEARSYFPELADYTIKVGTTVNADGKADAYSKAVFFRSRNVSYYVMGHELTHLIQGMGKVPKGERSCDIFTLARRFEFCDEGPNYVKVPRRFLNNKGYLKTHYRFLVHDTARTAVKLRGSGKRRYILWFERTLNELCSCEGQAKLDSQAEKNEIIKRPLQSNLYEFLG